MVVKQAYDMGTDIFDRLKVAESEKGIAASKTLYQELCLELIEANRILRLENFELKSSQMPPLTEEEWAAIGISDQDTIRLVEIFKIDVRGMINEELTKLLHKTIKDSVKSMMKQ